MPEKEFRNTYIGCITPVEAVEYAKHTKYCKNRFAYDALLRIKKEYQEYANP
jgi:hypothetical protein